ncbi:MAG TPA: TIGR03545 family protein [Deltaproteobacteria bacterium]|nr:TIGR03545 family protein [Deltaproteobacteria bacterium]
MKQIRWQGLAAFVVIVVLIGFFWFVLADGLIKRSIEKTGSLIVGAEVNVDRATLSFSPLGVRLQDIQVTNPNEPATNAVQISRVEFSVNTGELFLRKLIIEQMDLVGVEFGTQRKTPGFVREKKKELVEKEKEPSFLGFTLPSFSREDILGIIEKEDLQTVALIRGVQEDAATRTAFWNNRLDELPDKEKITQYRSRIENLNKTRRGGIQAMLSAATEVRSLHTEIENDIEILRSSRKDVSDELAGLKHRIDQAVKAPADDARKLADKYGPTPGGIGNVSGLIFGSRVKAWVDRSLWWYLKISPYLARAQGEHRGKKVSTPLRAKGIDVHFTEHSPKPNFLIRSTTASATLPLGTITGTISNITTDQDILGLPCVFSFSGEELKQIEGLSLSGSLDHRDPALPRDEIRLSAQGYLLKSLQLGSPNLDLALEQGLIDLDLRAESVHNSLKAHAAGKAKSTRFVLRPPQEQTRIYEPLGRALSRVTGFTVSTEVSGTQDDYDIKISSDLDRVIENVLADVARDVSTELRTRLTHEIQSRLEGQFSTLQEQTGALTGIDDELATRLTLAQDLLKNDLFRSVRPGG